MPDNVITNLNQVTPEWLTAVLLKSGALRTGAVSTIEIETDQGNWSDNATIIVRYTDSSQGSLPARLFLKMVNTDLDDEFFGASEVTYYRRDYVDVKDAPLIPCYDGAYSEEQRRYHILLDDVSQTHVEAAQKAPTLAYGLALAEGLAILHAHWWGAQRLAEAKAPIHASDHIQRFVDIAEPGAGHIIQRFSDELAPQWPETLRTLYARHTNALIQRTKDDNGFTLIHGDVGYNNILVPRDGDRPLYLIDRQPFDWSLTTWLGVYDLAYAIVLDWEIALRRQYEMPILKHYHAWLGKSGVVGYAWEQLLTDYRLCLPMCVYIATEYCRGGINERRLDVWLPMLQRSLTAVDDLNCSELW